MLLHTYHTNSNKFRFLLFFKTFTIQKNVVSYKMHQINNRTCDGETVSTTNPTLSPQWKDVNYAPRARNAPHSSEQTRISVHIVPVVFTWRPVLWVPPTRGPLFISMVFFLHPTNIVSVPYACLEKKYLKQFKAVYRLMQFREYKS
jgi:hypothetical protein